MTKRTTVVLSLGGSIIVPDRINTAYLKKVRSVLVRLTRRGYRFIIVTGGGDIARQYQSAAQRVARISSDDLDWIGIAATKINAELVRSVFGSRAYGRVIDPPTRKVSARKNILVGSGWIPGNSSDKAAVVFAKIYRASLLINMSNIRYVYTADPKKSARAKPIKALSWDDLLKLTGRTWKPGAHVPFDPAASVLAQSMGLKTIICDGTKLKNVENIIIGKSFTGTVIS